MATHESSENFSLSKLRHQNTCVEVELTKRGVILSSFYRLIFPFGPKLLEITTIWAMGIIKIQLGFT